MSNPLIQVQDYGQSVWVDNIRRKLLNDGTFKKLIEEYGVVGVTSNPAIFQKAIGGSDDYDAVIRANLQDEPAELYERLAVEDIQQAADMFRPVYDRTSGGDGYVSLEVSPLLAHKTQETVDEAKRLYAAVDRPNVMIKIPATKEGIPAIEETIAAGINVNVTLIFSVSNYVDVAEAYIRGLERRLEAGQNVTGIQSVASFFLSRIDTMIDQILQNNIRAAQGRDLDRVKMNNNLLGKAAIANAKLAYKKFMQIFQGSRFAKLREAGAAVQRPLWASTSTKNPAYPDTMYVDSLIGAHTVNTIPPDTLEAFRHHGTAAETLTQNMDDAHTVMEMLAEVGIDMDQITQRLQDDGVELFVDAFDSLINQVDAKRTILATGLMQQQKTALGIYSESVKKIMQMLDKDFVNQRIWAKDGSLWKDNGPAIAKIQNRLGWLDVLNTIDIQRVKQLKESIRGGTFEHVVLLGMGGSSLAPEVLSITFGKQEGFPQLHVLDSTDPVRVLEVERSIDLQCTLFVVASKSGSTIETDCFYRYFFDKTGGNGAQFIAITDRGSQLAQIAQDNKFRDIFLNPSDIGGRFSALSYFGLVPAALIGLDLEALWTSASDMIRACGDNITADNHPGASLGAIMAALAHDGRDKVCLFCSPSIASFGSWVEQLVAESTGKEGRGILPVVGTTVGKPHDYATDRLFVYLKVEGDPGNAELDEGIRALREAGHPRVTLLLKDAYAIAGEFFRWEYATAIAGQVFGINPFDEPNVTESKENTARLLKYYVENGAFPPAKPALTHDGVSLFAHEQTLKPLREMCSQHGYDSRDLVQVLAAQLAGTHAGDYFAVLAYLPPTAEIDERLKEIRKRLRHATRRAATIGYGPRYLHSTGQLHKGGQNNGVFFIITCEHQEDAPIPGAPYSFKVLEAAQATGDLEALETHKRRAIRLHITGDPVKGLQKLLDAVQFVEDRRQ